MESQQVKGSRVLAVESAKTWEFVIGQAQIQACPVVIHFTADWCAPSKFMEGFFEELALKYPDILFLSVDVDELKSVAEKLDVKAMPTFLFMKEDYNQATDKIVGANAEELHKRVAHFAQMSRQGSHDATSPKFSGVV
uniref:Thioredoxin domain-containing protein n=1 Tax=Araucaria cunninghamii TaxID=56994 RepID=A0A0D6QV02_ARACU